MQQQHANQRGAKKSHHSELGKLPLASSVVPMQIAIGARRREIIPMLASMIDTHFGELAQWHNWAAPSSMSQCCL